MEKKKLFLLIVSIAFALVGIILTILSAEYQNDYECISFTTVDNIELDGRFYENSEKCVIICHGFSSDFTNTYRLKSAYVSQGYSVLLFDFTGHGTSPDVIGMDNAQTDRLSKDIGYAVEYLKSHDFESQNIILAGHSMGARSILQYAAKGGECGGLVLIGAEVNLDTNAQASFFTGAVDTDMPFTQALSKDNPSVPMLLITAEWDDILPEKSAKLIMDAVGGQSDSKSFIVVKRGLHNYELVNANIIKEVIHWTNAAFNVTDSNLSKTLWITLYGWFFGLAMILVSPLLMYLAVKNDSLTANAQSVKSVQKYILFKPVMWIASLIAGTLFVGLIMIIPLPKPFFSVQFVAIVGGYGVVSLLLYKVGKMPFAREVKTLQQKDSVASAKRIILGVIVMICFAAVSFLVRQSGLNKMFTDYANTIWHMVFALFMSIGFYVLDKESTIVAASNPSRKTKTLWGVIKYFPFYLFAIFYLVLGSLSGLTSSVQGLLFLFYAIYVSKIVYQVSGCSYLAALTTAIILAVPNGAVF